MFADHILHHFQTLHPHILKAEQLQMLGVHVTDIETKAMHIFYMCVNSFSTCRPEH